MERRPPPAAIAVIALFAVLLLTPALLAGAGFARVDGTFIRTNENREPFTAPPPSTGALATGGWERDFERQLADTFPLRTELIHEYSVAKYAWLHDVRSGTVVRGRDGWLFYGAEEQRYVSGAYHPSDAELGALAGRYAERARWCAARGMDYVFVLAPNKSTIYPQYLPTGERLAVPTPADRLMPLLRARGVRVVDTRDRVRAASARGEVYSRGDTHWNDAGAYVAYRATVDALRPSGVRDTIGRATIVTRVVDRGGDLFRLGGLGATFANPWVTYDFPHRAHEIVEPAYADGPALGNFIPSVMVDDDPTLPAAVVFGDSFTEGLRPFLAESFRRAVFLRHRIVTGEQFDRAVLAREHPRVVIEELVERNLVFGASFAP